MLSGTKKHSLEEGSVRLRRESCALIAMAMERGRLEQRVTNQEQIITRNQATITTLQELPSENTACAGVYEADIEAGMHKSESCKELNTV